MSAAKSGPSEHRPPNQSLRLTVAAIPVLRGIGLCRQPRQLSLVVRPSAADRTRCPNIPGGKSGRVDLGGCPPKSPTDPGLHITAHPVPHLMNSRPARSVVGTWTWFRSRCTCQVSLQRFMRRHPLPLTGFLGLVPPLQRYYEVLRLPAAHFAALRFLRLAIPSLRPWFVPPAPDAEPWINRELVGGISSRLARWKRQGLPSSRRYPCDHSPYSSDPGVTRQAEWTMSYTLSGNFMRPLRYMEDCRRS